VSDILSNEIIAPKHIKMILVQHNVGYKLASLIFETLDLPEYSDTLSKEQFEARELKFVFLPRAHFSSVFFHCS
jgi:hypothetical protein